MFDRKKLSKVRLEGNKIRFGIISVRYTMDDDNFSCIIVRKDVGNAVLRNKIRRWIRSIFLIFKLDNISILIHVHKSDCYSYYAFYYCLIIVLSRIYNKEKNVF